MGPRRDPEEAEARFLKNRAEIFGEHGVDEFIRATEFLSKFGRRKSMNRKRSSYGLEHDAEREAGDHVANGMLIAAALVMGFSAERIHAGSPKHLLLHLLHASGVAAALRPRSS